eukprot:COSAG06_NODE_10239_length_1721_cov_143.047472_2_plen_28_part_01
MLNTEHFAKTGGSGQTQGKLNKRDDALS